MNARTKALMIGGVIGALLGLLSAWLYVNSTPAVLDETGNETIPIPTAGDSLKVGLGVLGVMRMLSGPGA